MFNLTISLNNKISTRRITQKKIKSISDVLQQSISKDVLNKTEIVDRDYRKLTR